MEKNGRLKKWRKGWKKTNTHQVHPGGPRPPGLWTGINTNGKTVRGKKSGKIRQH